MTGIDERPRNARFGTATPGAKAEQPSLTDLLAVPPSPRRLLTWRRILVAVLALALAGGGYAAGRFTAPNASAQLSAVTVTRVALPAGGRLTSSDLRIVTVDQDASIPEGALGPAAAARLIGLVTPMALPAGTFLTRSQFTRSGAVPGPAQALVGLALHPGQLPLGGLAVGQQVLVVLLPVDAQGQALYPVSLTTTSVWDVQGASSSGTTAVSVVVPAGMATRLASYAARGEVALIAVANSTSAVGPTPSSATTSPATTAHHGTRPTGRHRSHRP
jgi:hypothetical protein